VYRIIQQFRDVWFPVVGKNPPFWFRARDPKFKEPVIRLCEACLEGIEAIMTVKPEFLIDQLLYDGTCSADDIIVLSIMFDQMPRNALAIQYGRFHNSNPVEVKQNLDDSFSLRFAKVVLQNIDIKAIKDHRMICFFSLVFRHSNDFERARNVLLLLREIEGTDHDLPPLAAKFWQETLKREQQINS